MNQDQITLRMRPVDAKWLAEQKHTECAHFHSVGLDDILLWSTVPHLGPWCQKCDPEVAKMDLANAARASGASLGDGAMSEVKAYFDKGGRRT